MHRPETHVARPKVSADFVSRFVRLRGCVAAGHVGDYEAVAA